MNVLLDKIAEVVDVVNSLQDWIESQEGLSEVPYVAFTWTPYTIEIAVGDHVVWDDQNDNREDLNFEYCKNKWIEYCTNLKVFMKKSMDK